MNQHAAVNSNGGLAAPATNLLFTALPRDTVVMWASAPSALLRAAAIGIAVSGWVRADCPVDLLTAGLLWAVAIGVERRGWRLPATPQASRCAEAEHTPGHPDLTTTANLDDEPQPFASMQFTASYPFVVGMIAVLTVSVTAFAWDEAPFPRAIGMIGVLAGCATASLARPSPLRRTHTVYPRGVSGLAAMLARKQLHKMKDQERARLYFGRAIVVLELVRQGGALIVGLHRNATQGTAAPAFFLVARLMVFLYQTFAACAPPLSSPPSAAQPPHSANPLLSS